MYSPMQCGWAKLDKYTYICHSCLCHRNFRPYIEQIDEDERKFWEKDIVIDKLNSPSMKYCRKIFHYRMCEFG